MFRTPGMRDELSCPMPRWGFSSQSQPWSNESNVLSSHQYPTMRSQFRWETLYPLGSAVRLCIHIRGLDIDLNWDCVIIALNARFV